MQNSILSRRTLAWCLLTAVGGAGGLVFADDAVTGTYSGITAPSDQRGLNFNVPGVVHHVFVKEGDEITADDQKKSPTGQKLIAQQDDSVDVAELASKEADVKTAELQITAAQEDLKQKKVELKRDQEMFSKKVLGQADLDKAQLDVTIGAIRVTLAQEETEQKQLDANTQKARIEQKKLYATISGIVQKINVHDGELATNDPKTPCIQMVQNDPLWVEVDVPVAHAKNFKNGTMMEVRYLDEAKWQDAPIIYLNPVANPAAGTQRIRLSLMNPRKLRSGLQVEVHVKDQKGVAGAQAGQ